MTQALPKFPKFDSFVCRGDRRTVEVGPFTIAAVVHAAYDTETRHKWSLVGVVLSVFVDDVCVSEHAASLWGIDCNVSGSDNDYLSECADDLLPEALEAARVASRKIAAAIAA
jgi:hypothetical protein